MKESIMIRAAAGQDDLFRPATKKDSLYWEKRQKNNEAARRSRERRRNRVLALESHLQELKKENADMRAELAIIKRRFGLPLNVPMVAGDLPVERFPDKTSCSGQASVVSRLPAAKHSAREMLSCSTYFVNHSSANQQNKMYFDPRQSYDSSVPLCLKREVNNDVQGQDSVLANLSYPQTSIRNSAEADYSVQVKKENTDH